MGHAEGQILQAARDDHGDRNSNNECRHEVKKDEDRHLPRRCRAWESA